MVKNRIRITDEMKSKIKSLNLPADHPLIKAVNSNAARIYAPLDQLSFLNDPTKPVPLNYDLIDLPKPLKVNTCYDMLTIITSFLSSSKIVVHNQSSFQPLLSSSSRTCSYCKNNSKTNQGKLCSNAMTKLNDLYGSLLESLDKPLSTTETSKETSLFDKELWKAIDAENCFQKAYVPESEQIFSTDLKDLLGKITVSNQISQFSQMMITFKNQCDEINPVKKQVSSIKSTK